MNDASKRPRSCGLKVKGAGPEVKISLRLGSFFFMALEVWVPGSYMVHDRHVIDFNFSAHAGGRWFGFGLQMLQRASAHGYPSKFRMATGHGVARRSLASL